MKKGITVISISIAIFLIIILMTATVISATSVLEGINKNKFVTELLNLEDSVNNYKAKNDIYPVLDKVEIDISVIDEESLNQFEEPNIIENKITLYKIDYEKINTLERVFGNEKTTDDIYLLSIDTGNIYYIKGIKYNDKIYYKLINELEQNINQNIILNSNEIKVFDVIFDVSDISYTNIPIQVMVKLPKESEDIIISADQDVSVSSISEDYKYKYALVNTELSQTNYRIEVSYSLQNISKQVYYKVENFDIEEPEISFGEIIITADENNDIYSYLTEVKATDDLSKVKTVKYEYEEIENLIYFRQYGNILTEEKIDITSKSIVTIYAVDFAGNETLELILID